MRKIIFALALLLTTTSISAQEYIRPTMEELDAKLEELSQREDLAVEEERYCDAAQVIVECNSFLEYLTKNDPDYWTLDYLIGSNYYNMACYLSLAGKTQEALDAFEKSYEYGYYYFKWALEDSDLNEIRSESRFRDTIEKMREKGDYMAILKNCGEYRTEDTTGYPVFNYEGSTNKRIQNVRSYLELDKVIGDGDEISQIINLMNYVYKSIPHDGGNRAYCGNTAIDLYNYSKATGNGVNCRQLAIVLNDCYHAMGFMSRYVTCFPKNEDDPDCHVINSVWSRDLGKWVWMDPSFNAYVTDENGTLLGIREVRERMRDGRPYFLNEDANHNNESPQTKEHYLDSYMAKNLYWLQVPAESYFGVEIPYFSSDRKYVGLVPQGYVNKSYTGDRYITTSDADYFWQAPVFGEEE